MRRATYQSDYLKIRAVACLGLPSRSAQRKQLAKLSHSPPIRVLQTNRKRNSVVGIQGGKPPAPTTASNGTPAPASAEGGSSQATPGGEDPAVSDG
jgi:hypothetical protein